MYTLFITTVFSTKVGGLWGVYSFAFLERGQEILYNNYIKKANTQEQKVWQGLPRKNKKQKTTSFSKTEGQAQGPTVGLSHCLSVPNLRQP